MTVLRDRLGPDVMIYDWRAKSQGLAEALVVERNVMRLILMFVVGLAALNIVTGLIMLVKNKSRDIAILRTMGATKGAILRIFFMASASLGIIGLTAGLVLGVAFCIFIEPIQDFLSAVFGFDIFPGTVYSRSGADLAFHHRRHLRRDADHLVVGLALRSRGGAPL
jgi:lipoprotein-releasing system permease protein